ncbi:hypothetical protein BVY01_03135 [bacterium I07]|nr:hypothetical protein BVY01_03135 [bacterium I07]
MKNYYIIGLVIVICTLTVQSIFGNRQTKVTFPVDYRSWTHVKSVVIMKGHVNYNAFGGIHHVYANDKAITALKGGKSFTKGSVLVFDLLEEKIENNTIIEGPRKVIGVMEKDPDRFPETEGWGFEDFKLGDPEQRMVTNMREQCLSCHKSEKASDFVYSKYRLD